MNAAADPQATILDLLEEESALYRRLVALAEAKRGALLLSDIEALALLVREMESVAARCERLEQQRLAAAGHLMDPLDESFDALAPYFVGDQRVRLTGLRDDLRDSVGRLRDLNGMNAALVQQAVLVTDQWLRLLRASSPATYTRAGALSGAPTGTRYTYAV